MNKYIAITIPILLLILSSTEVLARGGGHRSGSYSSGHYGTGSKSQHEHVSEYTKRDGAHVNSYNRSTKDTTKNNNWSTKGNVNPDTGKKGTKRGD